VSDWYSARLIALVGQFVTGENRSLPQGDAMETELERYPLWRSPLCRPTWC
jgi:hypothetical protein